MTVSSQVKQTLASLKGSQSTLRMYSIQAQDEVTKMVYTDAIKTTGEIINNLEKRIKELEKEEQQYKGY
jgi:hypothetical protein